MTEPASSADVQARPRNRIRWRRVVFITLVAILVMLVLRVAGIARMVIRTTDRYDPPVMAGQPLACGAGFYARTGDRIFVTVSSHCYPAGSTQLFDDARLLGTLGRRPALADCPKGRECYASDFTELILEPDLLPWGHLDLVDLGAGGYRTLTSATPPLRCDEIHVGDRVETDGRTLYREGTVLQVGPYDFEDDAIFPCMVITDIEAGVGDSGASVLINGHPAGIAAREFGQYLGFTPVAEAMELLGDEICTDPDCELVPPASP